ncbi:MAG TPA: phosphatase PAP2 family protein [Bdellovibrionota bacterium]|nr:phosphatase PAP2 family protein [Bdellovibrionota bacterium]
MPKSWLTLLASPHRLSRLDVALTLIPALFWVIGVQTRSQTIAPWCGGENAAKCARSTVLPIDQPALGHEIGQADGFSYATQNLSGFIAIGATVAWAFSKVAVRAVTPAGAAFEAGADLLLFAQAAAWNGFFNEVAHVATARPRPFVYLDPKNRGNDPAHYTSFYSGHTSFAALAGVSLFLILLARGAPFWLLATAAATGQSLTFLTGVFRVLAGRHFITDVVAGALIGSGVALTVFWLHKRR